ncbi:heterodisulfide reductase-related iron-sulfur binding cluster [Lysinibacillus louembei]|uniref:Heterodisulfide reductase-related iron-sulfur binding cluster n=1 Tax=Lysinibacillus louembei TaxID=1470088 RepID=A0ABZ0S0J7_9BACI|nr:heterodisulfide reductase-related iron-sulfur binding cluster [Lysinibacillus louembei]WPK12558.1 heterodisulfide reductase-related iron-sulfur binding cluster [Lysinibacillus louembei]
MSTLLIVNWVAFIAVVLYGAGLFVYLLKTRYEFIRLGKKEEFNQKLSDRISDIVEKVFGQSKLLKDKKMGIVHVMFFYGFLLVQLGAIDLIWKGLKPGSHLPFGPLYPFFTFFQEIVALTILVAVVIAFYRRYVEKLVRLKRGLKNGLVLIFIGGLMISTLIANGMGLIWHEHGLTGAEPVASSIAFVFGFLSPKIAAAIFYVAWWVHLLILLTFLVYVPQSKHFHLITSIFNVFLNRQERMGTLRPIDFSALEEAEDEDEMPTLGVGKIQDFTQKQLIDLYACVECGRCTNMCPATGTGKMLSPMDLIVKLRDHLTFTGAVVTKQKPWVPYQMFKNTQGNQLAMAAGAEGAVIEDIYSPSLIGDVITEEEIWACTTCRNCEDQCPVMNEHVDKIIDLRRYLTMTEGKVNPDAQRAMTNIERQGNPWGLNRKEKENWRELDSSVAIPTVKELKKSGEEMEYLFWVGSMGSFDNRSQKIALAFARLMNEAGVKFAILGNKEKNSGDTPRRLGNEFLFQELATANIDEFEKNDVKKIVTIDPHAYNIFKNEYKDFGWNGEVLHHTELLYDLVQQGRLIMNHRVEETIVFHDSCYLGRYNDVYDPPREILKGIAGVKLVEMERNRETGMCCGAGGGLMWMEEHVGNRINVARTEQALATEASVISSGCPYCLTMLSDGTKAKEVEDTVGTFDIAEILERAVFGDKVVEVPEEEATEQTEAVTEDITSQEVATEETVIEQVVATEDTVTEQTEKKE